MSESNNMLQDNKALIRRIYEEALVQGNLAVVDQVFSADFVDHSTPEQLPGPGGVKDYFAAIRTGFPDIQVVLEDVIAEGERVVVRTSWRGTHLGSYDGVAATGRVAARTLIQIFRIVNGVVVEEWNEGGGLLDSVQRDSP
jgi:predicted ester cyclase